jgi:hypothetical protein
VVHNLPFHELKLFHEANKELPLNFGLRRTPIQLRQQPNLTTIQQNLKTDTPKEVEMNKKLVFVNQNELFI